VAQSVTSLRRTSLVGLGGKADIGRLLPAWSDAIDPFLPFDDQFCCDAQRCLLVGFVLEGNIA